MNLNIFMSPIMLPLYQNFTTFLCLICIFIPTFIFSCAKTIPLSMMMILRPAQLDVLFLENYYTSWTDRYCPLLDRVIALLMKKVDIDRYTHAYTNEEKIGKVGKCMTEIIFISRSFGL